MDNDLPTSGLDATAEASARRAACEVGLICVLGTKGVLQYSGFKKLTGPKHFDLITVLKFGVGSQPPPGHFSRGCHASHSISRAYKDTSRRALRE